jgi:hypothetical protein
MYDGMLPCQLSRHVFEHPALDIDVDEDEWIRVPQESKIARLEEKEKVEACAAALCGGCPILEQCREWAVGMGQDVFGVVGGLTAAQRPDFQSTPVVTNYTERGPLGQVRDDLIVKWAAAGLSNRQIAERLECNVRTVERRRAGLAAGTVVTFDPEGATKDEGLRGKAVRMRGNSARPVSIKPVAAARTPLRAQRVTAETAAMYDLLLDGHAHSREEIVAAIMKYVDREVALRTAPKGRNYPNEDVKAQVGARRFLLNRIDIAVRRGRINMQAVGNRNVTLSLAPDSAEMWASHRSSHSSATVS